MINKCSMRDKVRFKMALLFLSIAILSLRNRCWKDKIHIICTWSQFVSLVNAVNTFNGVCTAHIKKSVSIIQNLHAAPNNLKKKIPMPKVCVFMMLEFTKWWAKKKKIGVHVRVFFCQFYDTKKHSISLLWNKRFDTA